MLKFEDDKEQLKAELTQSFSKERLEVNISNLSEEIDEMREMMKRLSQLTASEVDRLKEEFEYF